MQWAPEGNEWRIKTHQAYGVSRADTGRPDADVIRWTHIFFLLMLQQHNINWGKVNKGIKQSSKHIPASQAVVLKESEACATSLPAVVFSFWVVFIHCWAEPESGKGFSWRHRCPWVGGLPYRWGR